MGDKGELELPERHVAIYIRVSSREQDLEGQERDLRSWCERQRWFVAQVYKEKASAWKPNSSRPQLARLFADARADKRLWDTVAVWAQDRWSRDQKPYRALVQIEELEALGINFACKMDPGLDTPPVGADPMIRLRRGRDLYLGQYQATSESMIKSQRIQVAHNEIRAGRRTTRSGRPLGHPRSVTPEVLARMIEARNRGVGSDRIAAFAGVSRGTALWYLRRDNEQVRHDVFAGRTRDMLSGRVSSPLKRRPPRLINFPSRGGRPPKRHR